MHAECNALCITHSRATLVSRAPAWECRLRRSRVGSLWPTADPLDTAPPRPTAMYYPQPYNLFPISSRGNAVFDAQNVGTSGVTL